MPSPALVMNIFVSIVASAGFMMRTLWVNPVVMGIPSRLYMVAVSLNVSPRLGVDPTPQPALIVMPMHGMGG